MGSIVGTQKASLNMKICAKKTRGTPLSETPVLGALNSGPDN